MNITAGSIRDHEALCQTANRLIAVPGKEDAIFICRSNYWHGILKLIEDRSAVSATPV